MANQFNKVHSFVEKLAEKQIDLSGAGLTLALTNTAHTSTWDRLSDLTEISYANLSGRGLTVTSSSQTGGLYTLKIDDKVLTASGAVGPFRYVYLYDDSSTEDNLIGYYDYESEVTLEDGSTFTVDFDDAN